MCGIVGIVSKDDTPTLASTLVEMTNVLRHRGPDGEGYAISDAQARHMKAYAGAETEPEMQAVLPPLAGGCRLGRVAFGHRRLAIVDVSARAHQPMQDDAHGDWIVFNGEVYNWRAIRDELESLGHQFRSTSDTEVILRAYQQWGEACVHRFNGEWAFAIFDRRASRLWLSRDRFGVKPLYVAEQEGIFAFASEPKALLRHPRIRARADTDAIYDFLVLGMSNHASHTFFEGIRSVEAGTNLRYDLATHRVVQQRYHRLGSQHSTQGLDVPTNGGGFKDLLFDAVRLRCVSEVPLGISLSGGIDSSSITVAARTMLTKPVDVFVAISSQETEDHRHAKYLLGQPGFRPHLIDLEPLSFDEFARLTYAHDQPLQEWFGGVGQWQIHRQSSQTIKVCLEGHGADEYLLGYGAYDSIYLAHLVGRGRLGLAWSEGRQLARNYYEGKPWALVSPLVRATRQLLPEGLRNLVDRRRDPAARLNGRRLLAQPLFEAYKWVRRPQRETFREGVHLSSAMLRNIYVERLPYFLHLADRNAMAHSVEARIPYLDHRLLEHVFTTGLTRLVEQGLRKAPLRRSMQGLLPEEIRTRVQKQGLRHSTGPEWFQEHRSRITEVVCSSPFMERVIDTQRFRAWLERDHLTVAEQKLLWKAIHLALWQEAFGVEWSS